MRRTFEDELDDELETRFEAAKASINGTQKPAAEPATAYEDVYFDSEEEDNAATRTARRKLTDEELFYDPDMDDEDEAWVTKYRRHDIARKSVCFTSS